jgi:hypothetical protein
LFAECAAVVGVVSARGRILTRIMALPNWFQGGP